MAPSKSAVEALQLFQSLADKRGLKYSHEHPPHIDLKFVIPPQQQLDFELMLTLQEGDELFINVDDVRFSFFPFPKKEVVDVFSDCVARLLDGSARIEIADRFGSAARGTMIRISDGMRLARYYCTFWPFWLRTTRTIQNKRVGTAQD